MQISGGDRMNKEKEIAKMHRLLRLAEEALRNCKMVAEDNEWADMGPLTSGERTIVEIVDRYFGDRIAEQGPSRTTEFDVVWKYRCDNQGCSLITKSKSYFKVFGTCKYCHVGVMRNDGPVKGN
jgi:hypothetical protein